MATISPPSPAPEFRGKELRRISAGKSVPLMPFLLVILLFGIILLSFLYLSAFNDLSSQGVVINDLQGDRSDLMIENEVWNMRISRLKSLDIIEEQAAVKTMVNVDPKEVEFIDRKKAESQSKASDASKPSSN